MQPSAARKGYPSWDLRAELSLPTLREPSSPVRLREVRSSSAATQTAQRALYYRQVVAQSPALPESSLESWCRPCLWMHLVSAALPLASSSTGSSPCDSTSTRQLPRRSRRPIVQQPTTTTSSLSSQPPVPFPNAKNG